MRTRRQTGLKKLWRQPDRWINVYYSGVTGGTWGVARSAFAKLQSDHKCRRLTLELLSERRVQIWNVLRGSRDWPEFCALAW